MDQSEIRLKLSHFCLTFNGLPTDAERNSILNFIDGANYAQLIRTASGDEKWLVLFTSKGVVEFYLRSPNIKLQFNGQIFDVQVEKSVPCDIPAEWNNQEVLSHLEQFRQGEGQVFSQQPQVFQPGQSQNFQYGQQGGIATQGQPRQMYPGTYYYPYVTPQYQNPYSPMQGQGQYKNQQMQINNQNPGFLQPQYPQGGPMIYGDPRYYNAGMFGNNLGQYQPYPGQRPPPPPYSNSEQQNNPHHMNAMTEQTTMASAAPQRDANSKNIEMSPTAPYNDSVDSDTTQNNVSGPEVIQEDAELHYQNSQQQQQQHFAPMQMEMPMPMSSAPWEVSSGKTESLDRELHEERKDGTENRKTNMISIYNLPKSTTKDGLTFFFENRRISGGGPIVEVDLDESDLTAVITFDDPEAVGRVLQKLPILFQNKQIKVEACYPGGKEEEDTDDSNNEDDEQNSVCTIEIHGVQPKTTDDTVEFYFENTKRSGGGEIERMKREENIIFITFKEEGVVQRVLAKKQHKIDGSELIVKQYIPPPPPKPRPMYEDRVFITGMNPETTEDCLVNFLEAKTSILPTKIIYGEEEGTALVTFEDKPDIEKLTSTCKKRPLEKHYLTISRVPVTNCIQVSGFGDRTSKDTLELYFENTKRSGGGEIEKVEMIEDDNICLVYFSDISDKVCEKSHIIDDQKLKVQIYYECLGQVDIDEEQEAISYPSSPARTPKFKVPDPLIISDLNPKKLEFLLNQETVKISLDKQMSTCHASIEWPSTIHDPLKIMCTLNPDLKDYKKLAKSWKKSAAEILDQFVNNVSIEKNDILQEAWDLVLDGLKSLNVAHPDGVAISIEQSTKEIFIVGYENIIQDVSQQVKKIVDEVTKELDRKKKQVKETMKMDKTHQLRILHLRQFPNKMADKFEGLKVKINIKKNEITFEGLTGDITKAKLEMYQLFQNIASTNVGKFSDEKLRFLESVEVKGFISSCLKEDQVMAVWEIDAQKNVFMYSLSDDEGVKGAHILKDAIVETPVSLKEEALCLLQSQKWQTTKSEIEKRAPGLIIIIPEVDKSRVLIYTVSKYAGEVRELIEDFLHENTIMEKQMSGPPGQMRFLLQYCKVDIENIAKNLRDHQVTITMDRKGIRIKGTSHGLQQAMTKIDRIVDMIKQKTHLMKKSSMIKYLLSDAGKEGIKRVEKTKTCVIESEPCYSSSNHDDEFEIIEKFEKSAHQDLATCVTSGGQRIIVKKGDITEIDVDVLVNASNKDLKHNGGLAEAIVKKGGMSIQDECDFFMKRNHGSLYEGDVYCSSPGNLKCKLIVHAVGPIWQGGKQDEAELLREVVLKSLEESEKRGYKSIAIPALCSGIFGYPVSQATKVITESIHDYFEENQSDCIKDIYLCDINDDNVEYFVKALIKSFGKEIVQQHNSGKGSTTWTTPSNKRGAGQSLDNKKPAIKLCKINIRIVKGQIAQQKVDVIINTTARDLNLKGGAVSSGLLNAGGQSLQDECSANYPNGIQFGDIAETSGGNLQCSKVLHGSLPKWDDGGVALSTLRTFMDKCLTNTSQSGLASVAFPALGTGNLGFPKDIVAKEMFQCVIDFSSKQPSSSVTEVSFILYDKDIQTVQAFEDEESKRQNDADADGGSRNTRKGRKFSSDVKPKQKQHGSHLPGKQTQQQSHQRYHGNQQGAHDGGQATVVTVGKLKLKVYQGDITKARVDVIVNSTNSEFDLTRGAVAQAILNKGGIELERQIKLKKSKMKDKGIVVTTSCKGMPSSYIMHVNAEDKRKTWKDKILKILEKSEKLNVKTVAYPALGTGLGTKIEEVADSLFDAMVEFQNSQFQSLTEVHMVIFQSQMMNSFIDQIKTCVNSTKGKKSKGIIATIGSFFGFTGTSDDRKHDDHNVGREEENYTSEDQPYNVREAVSVKLKIYSTDERTLNAAKDMIEGECEKTIETKLFTDEIIKEFSKEEEQSVYELGKEYGIEVKLEKRIGRLRLTGLLQDLMHANDDVYKIIRNVEKSKQTKQQAELFATFVKWHFIEITEDGNQLEEYPKNINLKLEMAYRNQDSYVKFCDDNGKEYTVDLNNLVEYPTDDPNDKVTVIRKDSVKDSTFEPPATWKSMQDNENVIVEDLKPGSSEYQTVINNFQQQAGQLNVIKCERIQNRALYQQYVAKKKSIDAQNPPGVVNEKMLWHGTAGNAVDSINAYGFNRSYCGKNAVVHGNGVYFAANAAYSCRTTYSPPDPGTGQRHIYQCKVLTGEFAQGQQGMRVPPNKPSTSGASSHILYDSVVDNVNNPGIFVIFNDTQAYPEYHITFT